MCPRDGRTLHLVYAAICAAIITVVLATTAAASWQQPPRVSAHAQGESHGVWLPGFHRQTRIAVRSLAWYRGELVVGSDVGFSGRYISRWNGRRWRSLGDGLNGYVPQLLVHDDRLIAVGGFTHSGDTEIRGVAAWDGERWSRITDPPPAPVGAIVMHQGEIIVGRSRHGGAGDSAWRWSGSAWEPLGMGSGKGIVQLVSMGDSLAATWNDIPWEDELGVWSPIAVTWNGSRWRDLATENAGLWDVLAILEHEGNLYLSCYFELRDPRDPWETWRDGRYVGMWDGSQWTLLGEPFDYGAHALAVHDGRLYAAMERGGIYEWDGVSWRLIEMCRVPGSMVSTPDGLVAHVWRSSGDVDSGWTLGRWDGDAWHPIPVQGDGLDGTVLGFAACGDAIVARGEFHAAGLQAAPGIATWNSTGWSATIAPLQGSAQACYRGTLYATGYQDQAQDRVIFRWVDGAWAPAGTFNDAVHAMEVHGDALVAGGSFTDASGAACNRVAVHRGDGWSPLGGGFDGPVHAIASGGGTLYAGGSFAVAGADEVPSRNIASWDGADWAPVGEGVAFSVAAVAVHGGSPAVASWPREPRPPDYASSEVWYWSRQRWTRIGRFNARVHALASYHGRLVAAGDFTQVDGTEARGLAWWDGADWQALEGGLAPQPGGGVQGFALEVRGDELWVGGRFGTAGGIPSANIGVFSEALEGGPWFDSFRAERAEGGIVLEWSLPHGSEGARVHIRYSADGPPRAPEDGQPLPGGGVFGGATDGAHRAVGGVRGSVVGVRGIADGVQDTAGCVHGAADGVQGSVLHSMPESMHTYYYAAFAEDSRGRVSAPLFAEASSSDRPLPLARMWRAGLPHPNPATAETRITLAMIAPARVHAAVFDVSGREVARLADADFPRGTHEITWTGRDLAGHPVASGVYLIRFDIAGRRETARVVRLR